MDDCIFCKIVKGELPAYKVYEDADTIAFESINPVADIHLLVCPKKHIQSFEKVGKSFDLFPMIRAAQKIIKSKNLAGGYKLVFNGGKYQSIQHLHWHLLGGKLEDNGDAVNKT